MKAGAIRLQGAGMSQGDPAFGAYALSHRREQLRLWAQRLGRGALARRACSIIRRLVSGGRAGPFDVEAFPGQKARLYPAENLSDKRVFAGAQFWDYAERLALGRMVRSADEPVYFVDAGANAGLYTLAVRAEAGVKSLKVLAIEPDPENLRRLRFNLRASRADEVVVAEVALGSREGIAHITASHANRGELTLVDDGIEVALRPMAAVLDWAGFPRIDALKIDIEGMEQEVLEHYLQNVRPDCWPCMIILEARRGETTEALALLEKYGYRVEERTRMNAILTLRRPGQEKTESHHVEA